MKRKMEQALIAWKDKNNRKPLLLTGARQVGKTYLLKQFGMDQFKNVAYFNLEIDGSVASYFNETIEPFKLIRYLEASAEIKITAGETLIILDEIQVSERALTSLKYFCEQCPKYHIIGARSLLGVAIHRQRYSFPVGKVESKTLYPLDFEEYLWARNKNRLCEEIKTSYETMTPPTRRIAPESNRSLSRIFDRRRNARKRKSFSES